MSEKKITLIKGKPQFNFIKVDSQIINDLSSGVYSTPAIALKELINNSYDADASIVTIRILPDLDNITVIDDGSGMNAIDFAENFAWISRSNKRNRSDYSPIFKRPLIGKIGIGFIAVNEICEKMEITSSKKGENLKFTALIDFRDITQNKNKKREIIKAKYELQNYDEEKDKHYTVIKLIGLKDTIVNILQDKFYRSNILKKVEEKSQNYFSSMSKLIEYQQDNSERSFKEVSEYIQFVLDLASYIPVEYVENGPVENSNDKVLNEIVEEQKKLNFKVDLDGIYLKKPTFFPKSKDLHKVYSFNETINKFDSKLRVRGYFYVQNKLLKPLEHNGVSIRIKGIPIARRFGYDQTFLDYPVYANQLFRNWISGEIYVTDGLEDAMNIDRQSFRETHPAFLALQDFLHKLLHETIFNITLKFYEEGKKNRQISSNSSDFVKKKIILDTKRIETRSERLSTKNVESPIKISLTQKSSVITINESLMKKFPKRERAILENIFLIFEKSKKDSKNDIEKLSKIFYEKIFEFYSKEKNR